MNEGIIKNADVLVSLKHMTSDILRRFSAQGEPNLMKLHRDLPLVVSFQNGSKKLIPCEIMVAMATKRIYFLKTLEIFLSETES